MTFCKSPAICLQPRLLPLAGLVLALSALPVRADVWTFETPSENVQCTVGQGVGTPSDITCTIIERTGPDAQPRPADCYADWGHTFTMLDTGDVEILCVDTSSDKSGFSTAAYGETGEFGGFTCHSSKKGLKCTNRDGAGFFLSKKKQTVFPSRTHSQPTVPALVASAESSQAGEPGKQGSEAAEKAPENEQAIAPAPQSANASLLPNIMRPDARFVTLNGHAIFYETGTSPIRGTLEPWLSWISTSVPVAAPRILEGDYFSSDPEAGDIAAIVAAHLLLSDSEKAAIESRFDTPMALFLRPEDLPTRAQIRFAGVEAAITNHAKRLVQTGVGLDEFTRGPVLKEIRAALKRPLSELTLQLPLPMVQLYRVTLGEYDFDKKQFAIKRITKGQSPEASSLGRLFKNFNHTWSAAITSDVKEFPTSIPMEADAAKQLLEKIAEARGDAYRVVNMGVFGDITSVTVSKPGEYSLVVNLRHQVKRIDFGVGEEPLGEVFHSVIPDKLDGSKLEAAIAHGASAPATLFGQEYLMAATAKEFPDFLAAPEVLATMLENRRALENANLEEWGLADLARGEILRPEVRAGERTPTKDDTDLYRAFLKGRKQAGANNDFILPVSAWVREEGGEKTLEPATMNDLVVRAFEQTVSSFGYLGNRFRTHVSAISQTPYGEKQGRLVFHAGYMHDGTEKGRAPIFVSMKLDKMNPNPALSVTEPLAEPATTRHGASRPFLDQRVDGELRGHLVLSLKQEPMLLDRNSGLTGDHRKAIILDVALKEAVLFDQGKQIRFDPSNVAEASAAGDGASGFLPPEQLELDAETSDLLVLRHLPDTVGDADIRRMLLARWDVENKHRDRSSQPVWGRFFELGQPKPDGEALTAMLPAFRAWSVARAAALPATVHVRLYAPNEPGVFGFGNTLLNPNALSSGMRSCETAIRLHSGRADYPKHKLKMLENACEYIRQAWEHPSDVAYIGRTETLPADQRANRIANSGATYPGRHGTVGARVECARLKIRNRDTYCRSTQAALKAGIFGEEIFVMDDAYVFDKYAEISPDILPQAQRRNARLRLTVEVAGISRTNEARVSPVARALAKVDGFIKEQALVEQRGGSYDYAPQVVDMNLFDLHVSAAELVDMKSGEVLAEVPLVEATGQPDETLLEPVKRMLLAPPEQAYGPDIVGLRLGMSFEEADRVIREHMEVGRVLIADRSWSPEAAAGDIAAFSSGVAYESQDGREVIIIHDEPPSASKVLIGAVRHVAFEKGAVRPEQVFAQAREKYGSPVESEGDSQAWGAAQATNMNCMASSVARQPRPIWREPDGAATEWSPPTFRGGAPTPMSTERSRLKHKAKCGPGITVTFDTRGNAEWDRLIFRLHDAKTLFQHVLQSEALIEEGMTFGGKPAADNAKTGIKF